MSDEVNRIIFECVDEALVTSALVEKETFYAFLKERHSLQGESIGENFAAFHEVMKSILGAKHYKIEQLVIKILHERTKQGTYSRADELLAFDRLVNIFIKDAEESIRAVRSRDYREISSYVANLEKTVREAQSRLREAERLAIIGQTAGMVGHDIRNPLQAIIGDLYLLKEELKNLPEGDHRKSMQESIESIDENVVYINKIVSDLQDYTRPLRPNFEQINIRDLLNSTLIMLRIPSDIETEVIVEKDLSFKSDAIFLRRAVSNLILNAVQAMQKGGKLTVEACYTNGKNTIVVQDTGLGVPDELKSFLFTPLFTTKSKGQGLGLAVVKRLVEALGGTVRIESREGNGSQFILDLPI